MPASPGAFNFKGCLMKRFQIRDLSDSQSSDNP